MVRDKPEPIIIYHRWIHTRVKCPHCNDEYKTDVTIIKTKCKKCDKEFEQDISQDEATMAESIELYTTIAIKIMQKHEEFEIWATERNKDKAERLATLLTGIGVEIINGKPKIESKQNKNSGRWMEIYVWKMRKHDYLMLACKETMEHGE